MTKKNANHPTVEMRIPWAWADEPSNGPIRGKGIDLDTPPGRDWLDALEHGWRVNQAMKGKAYDGPVNRKVVRT